MLIVALVAWPVAAYALAIHIGRCIPPSNSHDLRNSLHAGSDTVA